MSAVRVIAFSAHAVEVFDDRTARQMPEGGSRAAGRKHNGIADPLGSEAV